MPDENLIVVNMLKGANPDDPTAGLLMEDGYVADSRDVEFRNGAAFTRCALVEVTPSNPYSNVEFARAHRRDVKGNTPGASVTGDVYLLVTDTTPALHAAQYTDAFIGSNAVGGAGTVPVIRFNGQVAYSNGYYVFGGFAANLMKYQLGGVRSNVATTGGWLYLTGHKSRLVAAYKNPSAPSLNDRQSIGWSIAGNIDNWTGFGGNEPGTVLADSYGPITGLVNLRDILVVFRPEGIVLGRATGQATPAFYFENFDKDTGTGTPHPGTVVADKTACYFVGDDDIYTFDLSAITPIGGKARKTIVQLAKQYTLQGAILRDVGSQRGYYYILTTGGIGATTWLYDIREGTWQQWTLGNVAGQGPFEFHISDHSPLSHRTFAYFRIGTEPKLVTMAATTPVEVAPYILTRTFLIGTSAREYRLLRVLLSVHTSNACEIRVTAYNKRREETQTTEVVMSIPFASEPQRPHRVWFRFDPGPVGNFFSFRITLPSGVDCIIYRLEADMKDSGKAEDYAS